MAMKTGRAFLNRLWMYMASFILLLFVAYGIFGKRGYLQMLKVEVQNQKLRQEIQRIKEENVQMMREIKALKTDPKAIEKIAREELGMVKPGEIKITTAKPESKSLAASSPQQESDPNPSH